DPCDALWLVPRARLESVGLCLEQELRYSRADQINVARGFSECDQPCRVRQSKPGPDQHRFREDHGAEQSTPQRTDCAQADFLEKGQGANSRVMMNARMLRPSCGGCDSDD